MNILYCIAFILVAIFEFIVCKCIKDIYDRVEILEEIIDLNDYHELNSRVEVLEEIVKQIIAAGD